MLENIGPITKYFPDNEKGSACLLILGGWFLVIGGMEETHSRRLIIIIVNAKHAEDQDQLVTIKTYSSIQRLCLLKVAG